MSQGLGAVAAGLAHGDGPAIDGIAEHGLVPVVTIRSATDIAVVLAALQAGELPIAEITLRTEWALEAITAASRIDGFFVGAGTVTTPELVDQCVGAGAMFVVSPGLDEAVIERARSHGVPVLPGIATATELMRAGGLGIRVVKLFPAEVLGGVAMIDALAGPFPEVRFVPSGGVDTHNVAAYLRHRSVLGVAGSWMLPRQLIDAADGVALATSVAEAVRLVATLR
jgi:2-dehydro-3-deoxyphosphogluconate aldolase/(4S)-4-hydroxy-2-oxoglutarate aldolase